MKKIYLFALMIALGVASGMSDIAGLHTLGGTIAEVFIRIFKCISLPIIGLSIIVTLVSLASEETLSRLGHRTLLYTLTTTLIAAALSCVLYILVAPPNVQAVAQALAESPVTTQGSSSTYLKHIVELIPHNVFAPFLEHQVFGVILVSLVIGMAVRNIPQASTKDTMVHFFKGLHGLFWVITRWVVKIIPIGLYGFITTSIVQLRSGMDARGLGAYLGVIVAANLIQGFIVLPVWLRMHGLRPFSIMAKMSPALWIAFFSKSSTGALPVTMETAEERLGIMPKVSRFVLPLCTSINMNGCAAFIFTTVVYLMQNQGQVLSLPGMLLWIVVATLAAIGNAGVPMGCFFLSASLLTSMDVPISLLMLILPFYGVIDMLETALNVWSDICVTTVVNKNAEV